MWGPQGPTLYFVLGWKGLGFQGLNIIDPNGQVVLTYYGRAIVSILSMKQL